jgi:hypothetical protein
MTPEIHESDTLKILGQFFNEFLNIVFKDVCNFVTNLPFHCRRAQIKVPTVFSYVFISYGKFNLVP